MKAIANMNELFETLKAESNNWDRQIFYATGVIPIFQGHPQNAILFSNCGYIDLDYDVEYISNHGKDLTNYCTINNIKDLIEYIHSMESYAEYLTDTCYGHFNKSDLFWGIWRAIITAPENLLKQDGSSDLEWTLYSITMIDNQIALQMVLNDYDSIQICLDIAKETTLEEFLSSVVREMNEITADIDNIPKYKLYPDRICKCPKSFEVLYADISNEFRWLYD